MPAGQPFTRLCQQMSRPAYLGRADLHLHTTASDGLYTPAQIVDLAQRSGLAAVAITDHDTLTGVAPAQQAALGRSVEVIPGVEITAEYAGVELHLLGYFISLTDPDLNAALEQLRRDRQARFGRMLKRLDQLGVSVDESLLGAQEGTLGRRHLAELLVRAKKAATVREAFQRYLGDRGRVAVDKARLPVDQALALVRRAGGVSSWAHPSSQCTRESLAVLAGLGLQAVEVDFPSCRPGRSAELRRWARELGLAVTGGSDCHGPGQPRRAPGACGVSAQELGLLRRLAAPLDVT